MKDSNGSKSRKIDIKVLVDSSNTMHIRNMAPRKQTPEQFFARPRFADPAYVTAILRLVPQLLREAAKLDLRGRSEELLREEYDAVLAYSPELAVLYGTDVRPFPTRGTVPRADGTVELRVLASLADRVRFLAHLLQAYVYWAQKNGEARWAEVVAGLVVALKRMVLCADDVQVAGGFTR